MPIDQSLIGRTFQAGEPFSVTEERLQAFAAASGTPYSAGGPAPATFAIVPMFEALGHLIIDPEAGLDLSRIIHGQQRFVHDRPIVAGDVLGSELTVDSIRNSAGLDIIKTSTAITDSAGEPVCTAQATIIHRGPE